MKAVEAMDWFHGKEKFNCAQAVLKAFQMESGISEDTIQIAASQGGGRAPEGVCGALHAARVILKNSTTLTSIETDFAAKAGSNQCREIRGIRALSCRGCVALSAHLLEQHMDDVTSQGSTTHGAFMNSIEEMTPQNHNVRYL